jgi:hypothetical protein
MKLVFTASAFMLLVLAASMGAAQTLPETRTPYAGQAVRTIKIGKLDSIITKSPRRSLPLRVFISAAVKPGQYSSTSSRSRRRCRRRATLSES